MATPAPIPPGFHLTHWLGGLLPPTPSIRLWGRCRDTHASRGLPLPYDMLFGFVRTNSKEYTVADEARWTSSSPSPNPSPRPRSNPSPSPSGPSPGLTPSSMQRPLLHTAFYS